MAEQSESRERQGADEESNGDNSSHKAAVRAAAIAAATGATAIAAKKALSSRDQSGQAKSKSKGGGGSGGADESMLGEMLASGWGAAKDALVPFAEEAADAAGEWVGRNGPDLVRDTLVPRFIRGFQRTNEPADTEE